MNFEFCIQVWSLQSKASKWLRVIHGDSTNQRNQRTQLLEDALTSHWVIIGERQFLQNMSIFKWISSVVKFFCTWYGTIAQRWSISAAMWDVYPSGYFHPYFWANEECVSGAYSATCFKSEQFKIEFRIQMFQKSTRKMRDNLCLFLRFFLN